MKKILLGAWALASIILGMLCIASSSLHFVSANVTFHDGHESTQWYGVTKSGAIVYPGNAKLVPAPTVTTSTLNRVSH